MARGRLFRSDVPLEWYEFGSAFINYFLRHNLKYWLDLFPLFPLTFVDFMSCYRHQPMWLAVQAGWAPLATGARPLDCPTHLCFVFRWSCHMTSYCVPFKRMFMVTADHMQLWNLMPGIIICYMSTSSGAFFFWLIPSRGPLEACHTATKVTTVQLIFFTQQYFI